MFLSLLLYLSEVLGANLKLWSQELLQIVRALGKDGAMRINQDPRGVLLGEVKLLDRWSFALADLTRNMPMQWKPVDRKFVRR